MKFEMKSIVIGLIRCVSAAVRILVPGACSCRYVPGCSEYAAESVRLRGLWGIWPAVRRFFRCHPFSPSGLDLP